MSVIIRLKNLPMTAGAAEVRTFFSGLKIPDGAVHIIGGDEGEVFVGFASDEDARIAMMKNGKYIHNAEIRLFLSSKTEQNSVIQARKNGTYTSPKADFSPTGANPPIWPPQDPPANPYAAQSGYEASYPPQNSSAPRPDFKNNMNANKYNSRPDLPSERYPPPREPYHEPPRVKSPPRREKEDYGYNRNFHVPPPAHNQFRGPEMMEKKAPEVAPRREIPPPQAADKFEIFTNRGPPERNHAPPPADSWRTADFSKEPPPRNSFSPSKFPPHHGPPGNAPPPAARKTLIPHSNAPPPRHFHNGAPPPEELPPRNVPPSFHNAPPPRHPPSFNAPPPMIPPPINKPAVVPPAVVPPVPSEKFYIELTRLPNDLLRPAALEAFVHPTVPLTLSSVKTVYGPGGIHMHTIIRLDSIADYATMMRRNGEQGIKIVQSDKKTFDAAEDGPFAAVAPVAPAAAPAPAPAEEPRRRSRWADESSQKERSPPRRRTRSRSPYRKRRRSRSPRRRDQHTDPTRWCVQVTNVPFRMKEEELLEWFAEKVKPAKLTRTYYSDGNASDRWVAEFSSESLMRRAFSIRTLCQGRTLRTLYIDNDKADEIMKITDVYGMEKRQINEEARMLQENAEKANPPSFFNQPIRGAPPPMAPPPHQQAPPQRGNFQQRGAFRGGMMGRGQPFFQNGPTSAFNANQDNGSFRGGFHQPPPFRGGRGGGRGGFGGFREEVPTRSEFMDLIQSIGPRGTVLSCTGFPKDVTLEDVLCFFERYDPDRNSVRIRRGEDGVMTGECMLACFHQEDARQASKDLDGENFRNSTISVRCL